MAKAVQPNRKKISFVINIALTILAVYLLYLFIGTSIQINEKKATINDQSALLSVKATKQEELKSVLEGEFDNEYVEKVARSLGFVNSDEKVYEYIDD